MKPNVIAIIGAVCLAGLAVWGGCHDPQPTRQEMINAGNRHYWRAEYAEAIGNYYKAAELDPADADVCYKLGQCHRYLGNYREAIRWYRQAVKSFPGHRGANRALEEVQRLLPSIQPWDEPAETEQKVSPKVRADSLIALAKTYEAAGQLDRALENYQLAVEAGEGVALPHAELGRFYARTGRPHEAADHLKRALKLNPNEPNVAEELAQLGVH